MINSAKKAEDMKKLAAYRKTLHESPVLRNLFLELTLRCNQNCIHCGSRCGEVRSEELTFEQYRAFLDKIKKDFGTEKKMLCITGGEPLLRPDFYEIMEYANSLGFNWGMTSNATLIDDSAAEKLRKCGMKTISVSIDGLEETHNALRRSKDGYERAMNGINALIRNGGFRSVQVTTVVNHSNIHELEELYAIFDKMDIDSWRILNIEPIGRALDHSELTLTKEDYRYMFGFIRDKRIAGEPVTYGCSHYLGRKYEREVRDWYFLCNAGIYTASIAANGDILACLDIERRPELIQGNILRDDFTHVWQNGFRAYRRDLCDLNEKCRSCSEKEFCTGGAYHSWNFDNNEPMVCFKDVLF